MNRAVLSLFSGIAVVAGGFYLYKKYGGGKRKQAVAHAAGLVLGDRIGATAGYLLAGPGGAIVGSVAGAVGGVVAAERFVEGEVAAPQIETKPAAKAVPSRRRKSAKKPEASA